MEFGVLGKVVVWHTGLEVPLGGARQRRLLATLLLNRGKAVPLERLTEILWADPPPTARQQVHNAVAALRRVLRVAPKAIEIRTTDAGYLALFDPDLLDLERHRSLVRAARTAEAEGGLEEAIDCLTSAEGLWRGPALAGTHGRYLDGMAARLEDERLDAAHRRFALTLSMGHADAVVGELTNLVGEHPLRDPFRGLLMLALFRVGRAVEALDVHEEGRRLLSDGLGVDPSAQLRRVHRSILLGEDPGGELGISMPPRLVGPSGDAPHCSLPFAVPDFAGRVAELDQAADAADRSKGVSVCVIDGLGGIGKTAFAISLAHRLTGRYPDGQYFLDLHGFTAGQEPMAPAAALDILLRATGVPHERIPPTLDSRVELWRAETAGKRLLLVLDNVVNEAQVRPLLPGVCEAFVLVTSRRRLVELDSSLSIPLDALPPAEAAELFRATAGPDRAVGGDDSMTDVLELCGRLPLAIRVAASRYRARPSWTFSHLVEVLQDSARRALVLSFEGQSIAEVLGVSYRYLDPDRRRAFRLLSVIPGADFDPSAAGAVLDLPRDRVISHLEQLLDDNLLVSLGADRYGFHDLLREFARNLVEQQDADAIAHAAGERLLRHYEHAVRACTALIDPGAAQTAFEAEEPNTTPAIGSSAEATAWLEREYRNLIAAARHAVATDHRPYSWRLPCAIDIFLILQNRREDWRDVFTGALAAARKDRSHAGETTLLAALGVMERDRGAHDDGKRLLMEAARISREIGDKPGEALRMAGIGIIELRSGSLQGAYDNFSEARRLSLEAGDVRSHAAFTSNLSAICSEFGRVDEAVALAGEALAVFHRTSHPQAESLAGINMGRALLRKGRYLEAAGHLQDALELSRRITYRNGQACAGAWLATALQFTGPPEEGLRYAEEALLVARQYSIRDVECEALLALGWLRRSMSDLDIAEGVFRAVLAIAEQDNLTVHQAWAEDALAHLSLDRGVRIAARDHWSRALALHCADGADARATALHLDALDGMPFLCWRCGPGGRAQVCQD